MEQSKDRHSPEVVESECCGKEIRTTTTLDGTPYGEVCSQCGGNVSPDGTALCKNGHAYYECSNEGCDSTPTQPKPEASASLAHHHHMVDGELKCGCKPCEPEAEKCGGRDPETGVCKGCEVEKEINEEIKQIEEATPKPEAEKESIKGHACTIGTCPVCDTQKESPITNKSEISNELVIAQEPPMWLKKLNSRFWITEDSELHERYVAFFRATLQKAVEEAEIKEHKRMVCEQVVELAEQHERVRAETVKEIVQGLEGLKQKAKLYDMGVYKPIRSEPNPDYNQALSDAISYVNSLKK